MYFAIVDDLESDRNHLRDMIQEDCAAHQTEAEFLLYDSGEAFLADFRPGLCDAVFLDVLMDGISGIDTARKIREAERRLPVIIITTEPDFALDGFDAHVTDFLVKPLKQEKLAWCLQELRDYVAIPSYIEIRETAGQGSSLSKRVALDEILYARSDNHCVLIHTVSSDIRARTTFQEFTSLLPKTGSFYVCGRGLVVNFSMTCDVNGGNIHFKNGEEFPFSKRKQPDILQAFANYTFSRTRKGGWA